MTVTTVVLIMTVVIPLCLSVCCFFSFFFPLQKTTNHMKCINLPVKDIAL